MRYANLTEKTEMRNGEDVNTYASRLFIQWEKCTGSKVEPGVVGIVIDPFTRKMIVAKLGVIGDWSTYESNFLTGQDPEAIAKFGDKTSPIVAQKLFADFWEIAPWRY